MEVSYMRDVLKKQYNGAYKWVNRVNKMSNNQVMAVYFRMKESGQLKTGS